MLKFIDLDMNIFMATAYKMMYVDIQLGELVKHLLLFIIACGVIFIVGSVEC